MDLIAAPVMASGSAREEAVLDSLYRLDEASPDYADRHRELMEEYARVREEKLESLGAGMAVDKAATPDDIGEALSKNTVLLAYAVGDTVSLLWAIDRKGCTVYRLPKRARLREDVARLRRSMESPVVGDEDLRRSARDLYLALVKPAEERLDGAKGVIILPDGVLFDLPFEVLLTQDAPETGAWADMPFLANAFTVTYAPSASVYLTLRGRAGDRDFDKHLLAMGDPDYGRLAPLPGSGSQLAALPYSREEVEGISESVKDSEKDVFVGEEASEAVLKRMLKGGTYSVVHLAAHGIIDAAEPTASSVALCPGEGSGEDGYFKTLEIMACPMHAGLVVLSACESARGEIGRGEGVVGLSRAFLASGSACVVASLWPVSDESTSILMREFYRQMTDKKKPAGRAMNEARYALMQDTRYAHPFHWSSFVVIGLEDAPRR
jgi:CHAT domain-containing protein